MSIRVGMGYDVHQFASGRECWIGGVKIDHDKGLLGHSDADVLLHAISDALLGALALGDLGDHFPDTDPKWKGANSKDLLKACYQMVCDKGFKLLNVDSVVVCEAPKLKPHRDTIREGIAALLKTDLENISVKATTEEKLGYTGRGEGIKALAYVAVEKTC